MPICRMLFLDLKTAVIEITDTLRQKMMQNNKTLQFLCADSVSANKKLNFSTNIKTAVFSLFFTISYNFIPFEKSAEICVCSQKVSTFVASGIFDRRWHKATLRRKFCHRAIITLWAFYLVIKKC